MKKLLIALIFVITGIYGTANANTLPFLVEWGQSKAEVLQTVKITLTEKDNTLYFLVRTDEYATSTHFVFNESGKLYQVFMLKTCNNKLLASYTFNTLYNIFMSSPYKMIRSKGDLLYVFYDVITDSYILLNGFMEHGEYVVIANYEYTKTSSLGKHAK